MVRVVFFHQNFPPLFFTIIFTFHINLKINSRSLLCIVFSTFTKLVLKASLIWWSDLHRNITQAASQRTPYHHPLTSPLPSAAAMCTCAYLPPLCANHLLQEFVCVYASFLCSTRLTTSQSANWKFCETHVPLADIWEKYIIYIHQPHLGKEQQKHNDIIPYMHLLCFSILAF